MALLSMDLASHGLGPAIQEGKWGQGPGALWMRKDCQSGSAELLASRAMCGGPGSPLTPVSARSLQWGYWLVVCGRGG